MTKNFTDKLLDNLPQHMSKDSDSNNYKFLNSLSSSLEDIDNNVSGVKDSIQINTSTGAYLDQLGRLFGLNRLTDETDINFIYNRFYKLKSKSKCSTYLYLRYQHVHSFSYVVQSTLYLYTSILP